MLDTVLGAGDTAVNKTKISGFITFLCLQGRGVTMGRETEKKIIC